MEKGEIKEEKRFFSLPLTTRGRRSSAVWEKAAPTTSSVGRLAVTFQPLAAGGVLRFQALPRFNESDSIFIVLSIFLLHFDFAIRLQRTGS